MSEKKTDYRLPDCECATPCELSDAWRCAKDKGLPRLACDCKCHDYIRKQVARKGSEL